MCCRRHRRRAPAVVILGKFAYDKYQQHKLEKEARQQISTSPISRSPSPEHLESQANAEILEKAGIAPPSYNDVIVNRVEVSEHPVNLSDEKGYLYDDERVHDVADGIYTPTTARAGASIEAFDRYQAAEQQKSSYRSKCGQKKAERMARKEEKKAFVSASRMM